MDPETTYTIPDAIDDEVREFKRLIEWLFPDDREALELATASKPVSAKVAEAKKE